MMTESGVNLDFDIDFDCDTLIKDVFNMFEGSHDGFYELKSNPVDPSELVT